MDVTVQISEDGDSIGSFYLSHHDIDQSSTTVITLSGEAAEAVRNLTNLIVTGDAVVIEENSSSYTATAYYFDSAAGNISSNVSAESTWSFVGSVPAGTTLTGNQLNAGAVTGDTNVTLRAEYTYDAVTMNDTITVTIRNSRVLTNLTASGSATMPEQTAEDFTATAQFWDLQLSNVTENVSTIATWSVVGAIPPAITLTGNTLTAGDIHTNTPVRLQVVYAYENTSLTDTVDVVIIANRELTDLTVTGPAIIPEGESTNYTATARFYDGAIGGSFTTNVSLTSIWSTVGSVPPGTVFAANTLTAGAVGGDTPIQIQAVYTFDGHSESDSIPVTITADGPQDVTHILNLTFNWVLSRQTGTYFGRIALENPVQGGASMTPNFMWAIHPDPEFRFMAPDGTMADGDSYIDITQQVIAALHQTGNNDDVFDPGETVQIQNIEVYSRRRLVPPNTLFEVWAGHN